MDPCQDSTESSCTECMAFIRTISENPVPYLSSSVFSDLPTCRGRCGEQSCPVRVSNEQVHPYCSQHTLEHIVSHAQKVVLILGITVSTMFDGVLHGLRDRTTHLPDSCDVVICYDAVIDRDSHELWDKRTLIGMGGRFEDIIQRYPYLMGRCDIILNDYSTAKFFPLHFPETLFKLLRTKTGIALLQDLAQKPLVVPFRTDDQTVPTADSSSSYFVMLLDGREIRVDGIPRHQKRFTAAQLLFRVQTLTRSVLSRDTQMIYAGVLISADENLLETRASGSRFHLVQRMGLHFVEQYSTYFQLHQQYPYAPYPVVHRMQDVAAGVWLLRPRTTLALEAGADVS